ncbi:3706_t:CDS:2 [Entrophospora sp. SA101]|nr:3706_t:CDS:2 [Entrophospora sp. SA101]
MSATYYMLDEQAMAEICNTGEILGERKRGGGIGGDDETGEMEKVMMLFMNKVDFGKQPWME